MYTLRLSVGDTFNMRKKFLLMVNAGIMSQCPYYESPQYCSPVLGTGRTCRLENAGKEEPMTNHQNAYFFGLNVDSLSTRKISIHGLLVLVL